MSESENEFEKWFKNKCEHECLPYNSMREYCLRQIDLKDLWDYLWKKIVYYKGEFDFYFKKCNEQDDEISALEARIKELGNDYPSSRSKARDTKSQ